MLKCISQLRSEYDQYANQCYKDFCILLAVSLTVLNYRAPQTHSNKSETWMYFPQSTLHFKQEKIHKCWNGDTDRESTNKGRGGLKWKKVEEMREGLKWIERGKLKNRQKESWRVVYSERERERGEREEERGEVMRPVTGFTPRLCGN